MQAVLCAACVFFFVKNYFLSVIVIFTKKFCEKIKRLSTPTERLSPLRGFFVMLY